MVTNVFGNQPGQCPEDHSSGLLNGFQPFATVWSCAACPLRGQRNNFG